MKWTKFLKKAYIVTVLTIVIFSALCTVYVNWKYIVGYSGNEYYERNETYNSELSDEVEIKSDNAGLTGAYLSISQPEQLVVTRGDEISFELVYSGNISSTLLRERSIVLNGFYGTKVIKKTGDASVSVVIQNVDTDDFNSPKSISITGGTATSSSGQLANSVASGSFSLQRALPGRIVYTIYNERAYILAFFSVVSTVLFYIFEIKKPAKRDIAGKGKKR